MLVAEAAGDLRQVSLADALAILLVFAQGGAPQFPRAAVRWAARYLTEAKPAPDTEEAHLVLGAVTSLSSRHADAGIEVLHTLCERRGLRDAIRVLDTWQAAE